jgi:hypothetical protein
MHVFMDDSGDPGFKFGKGSTTHFVIACIIFEDPLDMEETSLKIKKLKRSWGWNLDREVKFGKLDKNQRIEFYEAVASCNFRVRAICVDKRIITSAELINRHDKFYNYMIKQVLTNSLGNIRRAKVRLDGRGDRLYKREALAYLKKYSNIQEEIISDIKIVNSKKDNLIQLADMVAGAIRRTTSRDKSDHGIYQGKIQKHIDDIWNFK